MVWISFINKTIILTKNIFLFIMGHIVFLNIQKSIAIGDAAVHSILILIYLTILN